MEYRGGDERIAFGPMAKGQKKYGATSSRFKKAEPVLVYNVQIGDTLQGLAVKFGVSTEQIRRANNLWTNDSLFLRDKLLIPIIEGGNGQDGSSGSQHGDCSSRASGSDTEGDLTSSMDNENEGSLPPCLQRLDDEGGRNDVPPTYTHPLCDEYYQRDCNNWENESDVPFGAESLNYVADHPLATNGANRSKSKNGVEEEFPSPNGHVVRPSSSMSNGTTSNPLSPTSQSSSSRIVDYSEKSAQDFLSRIDSSIASSRIRAKTKESQNNHEPWVTFDSDGESDHRHSSGTSITTQGRHLRSSLRKLEKAQDELFQL